MSSEKNGCPACPVACPLPEFVCPENYNHFSPENYNHFT